MVVARARATIEVYLILAIFFLNDEGSLPQNRRKVLYDIFFVFMILVECAY